jgi:O-acetyl-ADP-ribose deacetylase (regulator of RNase III)
MTGAGRLPARWVIHTVGPFWRGGGSGEAETLAGAYRESLRLAAAETLRTVAFPSISTGAYRYPLEEAARVAVGAVRDFLLAAGAAGARWGEARRAPPDEGGREGPPPDEVRFVLFDARTFDAYVEAAGAAFKAPAP